MSQGANVRSVDAIRDFKVALINFAEEAQVALGSTEMEIRQIRNWLLRDQLSYWQVADQDAARSGSRRPAPTCFAASSRQSNSDADLGYRAEGGPARAERQLREAEEKVAIIKKWIPVLEHALSEYHSQSQPLGDRLSGSFAATLSLLDRMLGRSMRTSRWLPPRPLSYLGSAPGDEAESTVASMPAAAACHRGAARGSNGEPTGEPYPSREETTAEYAVPQRGTRGRADAGRRRDGRVRHPDALSSRGLSANSTAPEGRREP